MVLIMKKMMLCLVLSLVILTWSEAARAESPEFKLFSKKIRQALKSNDQKQILELMSDEFEMPGYEKTAKQRALSRMTEEKILGVLYKALNNRLVSSDETGCEVKDSCYSVWSKTPDMGFVFTLVNGKWLWSEWRAQ